LCKGATIADENRQKTTSENLPEMYKMSLQIFRVCVLFIAQNCGCTKMSFLFINKFISEDQHANYT